VKPLAIDLYCGLGGWTEGLLAEGYEVVGFDIERHDYGTGGYPAQLVLQDALTLHGSQFKDAALIVASPPCQFFSYCAMPWSMAKQLEAEVWADGDRKKEATALFDACFRIQREAIEAAGHFIPLVVENVRGAQKWVGRSRWNYGSFHLWGDVPALMPMTKVVKNPDCKTSVEGVKNAGTTWRANGCNAENRMTPSRIEGTKNGNDWFGPGADCSLQRKAGSHSKARKAASAAIAKIPLALSRHIANYWKPKCDHA
jgi:hypothetical protein